MRASLAFALAFVFALTLAGCAKTGSPGASTPTLSADQLTPAGGKAMLAEAAASMPDGYVMDLALTSGSAQLMTLHGAFDNATGEAYAEFKGDPSAWPNATQGVAQYAEA